MSPDTEARTQQSDLPEQPTTLAPTGEWGGPAVLEPSVELGQVERDLGRDEGVGPVYPMVVAPPVEAMTSTPSAPAAEDLLAAQIVSLQHALVGRTVIGQAVGVLMERFQMTAEEAFELLRMSSQRQNRKLRDVAAELLTTPRGTRVDRPATARRRGTRGPQAQPEPQPPQAPQAPQASEGTPTGS